VARLPTTARIAALSILLALLSNLALIGFIHFRTHDDALGALRQRVSEQADVLADLHASGGRWALADAINHALRDDSTLIVALVDGEGRVVAGNLVETRLADFHSSGFQTGELRTRHGTRPKESGFVVRTFPGGDMLVSGRSFDERLTLQRTLERSLFVALALSLLLGVACGLLIARYVGQRVGAIVDAVDEIGEGDLSRRAPVLGGGSDAFDRLSARINRMMDRIAALMDELRVITDSLAHDLRSPVGRLRSRIERALATEDDALRDQLLAGVLEEADALTRMLTTVIEISRSEAMAGRQRFARIDPAALVGELAEMYEPLAEEAGVRLQVDVASPQAIMGHRQLLAQAMSNLVDNALLHGASGGCVTLSTAPAGPGMVRLGVSDRGPGIAPADHAEALRRFGRLDSSRSAPGAGLGLALASAVAHLHGGRLELDDARPGLVANILLPLDTRPAAS